MATAPELGRALDADGGAALVVLDLRAVTFMDSSGLGLIVEPAAAGAGAGFRFAVAAGHALRGRTASSSCRASSTVLDVVDGPEGSSPARTRRDAGAGRGHPATLLRAARRGRARPAGRRLGGRARSGRRSSWPRSLQTVVRVVLTSRFSMWMAWGPELTFFCNDAYRRDTLGTKYPWALGRPAREVWAEIWPDIGPRIERVLRTGVATWDEALLLFLERSGYPEETYHTFSYSPLTDDDGRDRRDAVRRQRGHRAGHRRAADGDAARPRLRCGTDAAPRPRCSPRRAAHLGANPRDLPFALVYLFDEDDGAPRAALPRHPAASAELDRPGPLAGRAATPTSWSSSTSASATLPTGAWDGAAAAGARCCRCPQQGQGRPYGFLVAGLNRYRPLDDDYRGFLGLVAGQIAAGDRQRARLRGRAPAGRGAGRARPGQDRVLHQRQPRAAHAADAAARARPRTRSPTPARRSPRRSAGARGHQPQRPAAAEARQHAARLLAARVRARPSRGFEPVDLAALHRRAGEHVRVGDRARRAGARRSTARRCPSRSTSTARCGRRSSSTCSRTR